MISTLFGRNRGFTLERTYPFPAEVVWDAWTRPELLQRWWGPENTTVTDCDVDARVGGRIHVVMTAGPAMGKYAGTRWPMEGTFTVLDRPRRITFDARSWTEGEEVTGTIEHVNDVTLREDGTSTHLTLDVQILKTGSGARMASFGMRMGYKAHLEHLDTVLAADGQAGA